MIRADEEHLFVERYTIKAKESHRWIVFERKDDQTLIRIEYWDEPGHCKFLGNFHLYELRKLLEKVA